MEKTALIFGASSGIGLNISALLAEKGYRVYNSSRRQSPDIRIQNILCDTSKGEEIENVYKVFREKEQRLDTLIYCSGASMAAPFEFTREEDYRYLYEVNFFGLAKAVQLAVPLLKDSMGKIILISSHAAVLPVPYDLFYSCAKASVNAFAMALRLELDNYGIKVVSVMPGGTNTDFTHKRLVYNNMDCGTYANQVMTAADALAEIEQNGMSPYRVAEIVIEVVEDNNPSVCITAGLLNKLYNQGAKIMPKKMTLEAIKSKFHI